MERRLAAILAADVVGYSKLMARDEVGTLAAVSCLISDFIEPLVAKHNGRIVKLMGDGILTEFGSVVDAVECAIEWQDKLAKDNSNALKFRIGINLGDIIFQDGDIFGNGVNIASRLEGLADVSGICISDDVYRQTKGKVETSFEDMGELNLKNIEEPVRAYRIGGKTRVTAPETTKLTNLGHSDKASIAVLPFDNMSEDREQEYFSDGMSDDIITQLSRFRTLNVIARNSSFAFKNDQGDIKEIGVKLGTDYLLQGSVRRAGNRVRITAQLIEARTGNHLWAERYDRDLKDLFAVQDEVTQNIVAVLPGRVQANVADRVSRKPTNNIKAYELMLQGKSLRDSLNAKDTAKARILYEKALVLDPHYARVYMYLADTYVVDFWLGLADADTPARVLEIARKGVALDNTDVFIQDQLGYAYLCAGLWDDADRQFEKTLSQIVNEAESMAWCGYGFLMLGRHDRAKEVVLEAMRLDPLHPPALNWVLGQVRYFAKQYDEAVNVLMGDALLNSLAHAFLVAALAQSGRIDEAQHALTSFIKYRHMELSSREIKTPPDTVEGLAGDYKKMWREEADWDLLADGLRKAGLPESVQTELVATLPERPSIAVLPFDNMSGDAEQEYFSDGISEDIITELSRSSELFVIARNSSFAFKGQMIDAQKTAKKLGVQYLVEGSVRKSGDRIRITAQLIDALNGSHLWADRFDRNLTDIFDVQDEVVRAIVGVLPGRIAMASIERVKRKPLTNLTAYDFLLRGNHALARRGSNIPVAIKYYKQAILLDEEFGAAYASLGIAEGMSVWDLSAYNDNPLDRAYEAGKRALELAPNDYRSHAAFGEATRQSGEHSIARNHLERAMKLNPNSVQVMGYWAMLQAYSGDPASAIETYNRAVLLDPFSQDNVRSEILAEAYYNMHEYNKSIEVLKSMLILPIFYTHQQIAISYAQLGMIDERDRHMELYRAELPESYDEMLLFESHLKLCAVDEDREHWRQGYRLIGLDV